MASSEFRKMLILSFIPRRTAEGKEGISVRAIRELLDQHGFEAPNDRTLQRDLNELVDFSIEWASRINQHWNRGQPADSPLAWEEQGKTKLWFWDPRAPVVSFPSMTLSQALGLDVARRSIELLCPPWVAKELRSLYDAADSLLTQEQKGMRGPRWADKVRVIEPALPVIIPPADNQIFAAVTEALFDNHCLEFTYQDKRCSPVHPLALIYWGKVAYLIGYEGFRDQELQRFKLSRLSGVSSHPAQRSRLPQGFSVDQYIAAGEFGQQPQGEISMRLRLRGPRALRFIEGVKLSNDQVLTPLDDGGIELRASVQYTRELVWTLLGYGADAEVLAPATLRAEIAETAVAMAALYDGAVAPGAGSRRKSQTEALRQRPSASSRQKPE